MQERRLLQQLTLDDIPSSATLITSSNYSTVSGNVIYIPLNEYTTSNNSYTAWLSLSKTDSSDVYVQNIDLVDISAGYFYDNPLVIKIPFYYTPGSGSTMDPAYFVGYMSMYTSKTNGRTLSATLGSITGYGATEYIYNVYYPTDKIYYSRIELKDLVIVSDANISRTTNYSQFFTNHSIYIGNE